MKTASILLVLVVVLGFVREAGAASMNDSVLYDFTIEIAGQTFGFKEWKYLICEQEDATLPMIYLGPLGQFHIPFTATQGLIGFIVILVMLISLPVVLTVRWQKKRLTN